MKTPLHCLTVLWFVSCAAWAQEVKKLDAGTLDAAFSKEVQRPTRIAGTKGVHRPAEGAASALVEQERTYSKSARIIKHTDGTVIECPFVDIPILFAKNTSTLLGDSSRENVGLLARKLKEYGARGARFSIEGHASAEGDGARNQNLSSERAVALRSLLVGQYGVDGSFIQSARGFGSRFARASATAEDADLQQDRRVLVVKEQ